MKGEEEVVQPSRPNVRASGGKEKSHKEPIKRTYPLGYVPISFLLDSWKKLLHAIFGSQETTEEVMNGDQLLLPLC